MPSRQPLYLKIAESLRTAIAEGEYPPDTFLPSERELAEQFECSRVAVRQALRELRLSGLVVSEHGRGNRVTGRAGKNQKRFIGMVTPYIPVPRSREIVFGVEAYLAKAGCDVMVANSLSDPALERERLDAFVSRGADGLIVICEPTFANRAALEELGRRLPVVVADRVPMDIGLPVVRADEEAGARAATEHLLKNGHRTIALITRRDYIIGDERARGVLAALEGAGVTVPDEYVVRCDMADKHEVYRTCVRLLSMDEPPTALVTYDDGVAGVAYEAAADFAADIPTALSVLSLSESDVAAYLTPPLTAVDRRHTDVGRLAAENLLRRLQGEAEVPIRVSVTPTLNARGSVLAVEKQP